MSQNKGGNLQNIFQYHFGLRTTLKSPSLDLNPEFSIFRPLQKNQFSSITPFLDHIFSIPYCRKGSYGPYGPFWFSVKK